MHEIDTDGRTVWVSDGEAGANIGRFGPLGIDIHHRIDPQTLDYVDGEGNFHHTQCADCRHDLQGQEAWQHFKTSMDDIHGVVLTEEHKPKWID